MIGSQFGRLTVLRRAPATGVSHHRRWLCACACGNYSTVNEYNLLSGRTRSCGCLHRGKWTRIARAHQRKADQEYDWQREQDRRDIAELKRLLQIK